MNLIVAAPGRIMFRAWGDAHSWNVNVDIEPEPGQDRCTGQGIVLKLGGLDEKALESLYRMVLKDDG